jgi:hypothetical protein
MTADVSPSTLWLMAGLGAFHGINPAMGWLFAVALGLQDRSGRAVVRALVPIALGHLLAVGGLILLTTMLGVALPMDVLRVVVATVLMGLGGYGLFRHLHPRWVRMRVGFRDLVFWSCLVATVHGAGLMVVPALLGVTKLEAAGHAVGHAHAPALAGSMAAWLATSVHTASYLVVMGLVAGVVYRWLGVGFLRTAWLNIDLVWAVALITTGIVTLVL